MLVSESWLRELVSPGLSTRELAERLTLAGLEVESIQAVSGCTDRKRLVVGRVIAVQPHADAQQLQVCQVEVGRKRPLTIVCAAPDVAAGITVPVALPGCRLGEQIMGRRVIRGVESTGMLCSAADLGLEQTSGGLMMLDPDAPIAAPIVDYLDLTDHVFTLQLTPNRGDCLSIGGVAREVSALTGARLKAEPPVRINRTHQRRLGVELAAPAACPRYIGRALCHVRLTAKTPDWMAERLRRSGLRSINPAVDVTNYVMLERGQPMHAFDLDRLDGDLTVRMAATGEAVTLLDGSRVTLADRDLVIADQRGAVALAGIMGGNDSAVSERSTNIYLEAAYFAPSAVAGKARQLGRQTDAAYRFERGVDSQGQLAAMQRATQLLMQIAGAEPGPITHAVARQSLPKRHRVRLENTAIRRTLGRTFPAGQVTTLFNRLGMQVTPVDRGWRVQPPSWRFDISGAHDLVEELGRCFGFDKIEPRLPRYEALAGRRHPAGYPEQRAIKSKMVFAGFNEAITYSFVDPQLQAQLLHRGAGIKLINPIADNMAVMRQSLWPGLLMAMKANLNRQQQQVRLFEIGRVFPGKVGRRQSADSGAPLRPSPQYREVEQLAAVMTGPAMPRSWASDPRPVDFFDARGVVEQLLAGDRERFRFVPQSYPALHPGRTAAIYRAQRRVGYVGQLHPAKQAQLGIDQPVYVFELETADVHSPGRPVFQAISRYPAVRRDLAVVVEQNVLAQQLLGVIKQAAGNRLTEVELFDVYSGAGVEKNHKSFAFGLTFQAESSNLTGREVELFMQSILTALQSEFNAVLRD